METYVDIFFNTNGEQASTIHNKLLKRGLKPTLGEHDFVYNWNGIITIEEELKFIDRIQSDLKDSGAILKFSTKR